MFVQVVVVYFQLSNGPAQLIITWQRVFQRVDSTPFSDAHRDFEMSWDRVIQDSDEDEPFGEDEIPTTADKIEAHEPPRHLDARDHPANQHTTNVVEHIDPPEPQLGVDFDQFLQSQDISQTAITYSQQKREERWIPSTANGGESVGTCVCSDEPIATLSSDVPSESWPILTQIGTAAMMTEIGLAQQRLFDDDAPHTGHGHSMSTTYPSGVSEPCSFPMHYDQQGHNDSYTYARPFTNVSHEATQLIAPPPAKGHEYSTPAASTHTDSPVEKSDQMTTAATSVHPNEVPQVNPHKPAQRNKTMHSEWNSPHDTEPNSSVRSPQLNRSKSDHGQVGPMSPQHSPASTQDELSMPAVTVQIAPFDMTPAKKRGRPKKQSLPQNDEDDELAITQNHESLQAEAEKRRPGRLSESENLVETKTVQEPEGASSHGSSAVNVANGSKAVDLGFPRTEESEQPAQQEKPEPRKKRVRRSKTAPDALQQPSKLSEVDDVIWVESRPLEDASNKANSTKENRDTSKILGQISSETQPVPNELVETPAPAPKKRGRKRKMIAEETAKTPSVPKDLQPESKSEDPVISEATEQHTPISNSPEGDQKESTTLVKEPEPESESTPQPDQPIKQSAAESLPQTPQVQKPRKAHSPISSTSKVPYRVGLSKRARIAPLLKVVRK